VYADRILASSLVEGLRLGIDPNVQIAQAGFIGTL
jgi:hypothetical protein